MADAKFISDAEAAHNRYRADHGAQPITHNKDMSKMAQKWADHIAKKGSLSHSSHSDRKHSGQHCGENCAMSFTSSGADFTGDQVVEQWYSEIVRYDFNKHGGPSTGHFTQVVWNDSKEFGIGKAKAKDGAWYVVANYCPAGNMMGDNDKNVFPSGKPYTPTAKASPAGNPSSACGGSMASDLASPMQGMNMKGVKKSSSKSTSVSTSTSRGPDGKTTIKKITTETIIDEDGNETKNVTEEVTTK